MEKELEAPLRQSIGVLEKYSYRYAIIGGVALAQWGVVRATYDVDIKILVPDLDFDGVRANLRTAFPIRARHSLKTCLKFSCAKNHTIALTN